MTLTATVLIAIGLFRSFSLLMCIKTSNCVALFDPLQQCQTLRHRRSTPRATKKNSRHFCRNEAKIGLNFVRCTPEDEIKKYGGSIWPCKRVWWLIKGHQIFWSKRKCTPAEKILARPIYLQINLGSRYNSVPQWQPGLSRYEPGWVSNRLYRLYINFKSHTHIQSAKTKQVDLDATSLKCMPPPQH